MRNPSFSFYTPLQRFKTGKTVQFSLLSYLYIVSPICWIFYFSIFSILSLPFFLIFLYFSSLSFIYSRFIYSNHALIIILLHHRETKRFVFSSSFVSPVFSIMFVVRFEWFLASSHWIHPSDLYSGSRSIEKVCPFQNFESWLFLTYHLLIYSLCPFRPSTQIDNHTYA